MIECSFENGHQARLRHVTADAVLLRGDNILLVRRADHLVEGGKLALPGGYLDRDETIQEGIRREILEETGFDCSSLEFISVFSSPNRPGDNRQNVTFIFSAQIGNQLGVPDEEVSSLHWFPLDDLPPPESVAFDHMAGIEAFLKRKSGEQLAPSVE